MRWSHTVSSFTENDCFRKDLPTLISGLPSRKPRVVKHSMTGALLCMRIRTRQKRARPKGETTKLSGLRQCSPAAAHITKPTSGSWNTYLGGCGPSKARRGNARHVNPLTKEANVASHLLELDLLLGLAVGAEEVTLGHIFEGRQEAVPVVRRQAPQNKPTTFTAGRNSRN